MCEECQWMEDCIRLGEIVYSDGWKIIGRCIRLNLGGKGGIIWQK